MDVFPMPVASVFPPIYSWPEPSMIARGRLAQVTRTMRPTLSPLAASDIASAN